MTNGDDPSLTFRQTQRGSSRHVFPDRAGRVAMSRADTLEFAPDFVRATEYCQAQDAYSVSPLIEIEGPGDQTFLAKDESNRMGLGAFKALGAPYAISRLIDRMWRAQAGDRLPLARSNHASVREFASRLTFVCASAGNHGVGVAAGARAFGASSRIYLARTVPAGFADRLKALGAEAVISGNDYEASMAAAVADADGTGAILLADSTWPGYTEIPKLVMEGYCVIAEELRRVFSLSGRWPTRVYLQAGVGGLAAAMAHMIRLNWAEQPDLVIVEPEAAACLKASHLAGRPERADGPDSIMGRLDCKEPSIVAWRTLERCNVSYETISDDEGNAAARDLSASGIATTPSGAAGFAALRKQLPKLDNFTGFRPLVIVSEGPLTPSGCTALHGRAD